MAGAVSALFLLDIKGRVLVWRDYRGDVSALQAERFFTKLLDKEGDAEVHSPVVYDDAGVTYMFIQHNNVFLLTAARQNCNAASILLFLHRVVDVFKHYFEELEEESLRDNFVVVYELLDEMMDFGYPQYTEAKILSEFIKTDAYRMEVSQRPPMAVTNAVSWRSEGIRYKKNEVFLDVVESVNILVNSNGQIVRSDVVGALKMRTYLSGMPECKLGLNDRVLLEAQGRATKGKAIDLDDIKFHQCVRLARFENDRTISFIPPDGAFDLMTYRLSTQVKPLIWVEAQIEKHSRSRIELMVKARSQFKERSTATNVEIEVPVPSDATNPNIRTSMGSAAYAPERDAMVWKVKSFPGGKEYMCRAEFSLPSITAEEGAPEKKAPIRVKFEIPYFTVSGIQVRYLKIIEKSGYQALPWLQWWMESVAALEGDAEMLQDDFGSRPSSWSPWSAYQISKRADEMRSLARSLKSKGDFETVVSQACSSLLMEMPSSECVGREPMLEELYALVQDDSVSIVGIHGMAGVGKSTLLRAFHNGMVSRMAHLDIIICAEMPDDDGCDYEEELQISVINQLRLQLQKATKKDRAAALFSTLSKKKFLLVIDNLWVPINLGAMGIPCSSSALRRSNSKIVLATRNEEVCDRMDVRKKMRVGCLPWESSWALFQGKAAGAELVRSSSEMRAYAEELARNCGGLPFALVTVARAMASKRTVQEWKHATMALSTRPGSIAKTWVIDYCIGEEAIDGFSNPEEAVHPVVRLLIAWMVSACGRETSRWLVRPGAGLTDAPDSEGWKRARRMSLMDNQISVLPSAPSCPDLLTLLLCENRKLAKIPDTFFQSMPRLRVLDLSNTAIERLPVGIRALPDLQHLDVSHTNLVALPQEVGTLGELRFLQLSWTPRLRDIPSGVISSLLKLRALHMYSSYADWEDLDELESLWQLRSLDLTLQTVEALKRLATSAQLGASTRRLHMSRYQGLRGIRLPAGALWAKMNALHWLRISNCANLEDLSISVDGRSRRASLPSLQELVLHRLPKVKIVWRGDLPFL
ncbi:AP-1 complex subunit mu-2 [Dichanthelium oligosanthes]|uniref:AP-1 complex subunit mu-2 n=1 Tax=Dichanthelium oligosanthes TaxID=888268 RepID=A0A1E5VFI7_9POAL|nr:AP-1 complex subunit mu-2 [Dichanthelium oligosanthes]